MAFYPLKCEKCDYFDDDVMCSFEAIKSKVCPECGNVGLVQDVVKKIKTLTVETEDTWGIEGHYSIHTERVHGRSDHKKWEDGLKRKADEQGREIQFGKDRAGPRDSRGERISDDIAKHGRPAIDHYRLESKQNQAKLRLAEKEKLS